MDITTYPAIRYYTVPTSPRAIELIMMHSTGGVRAGDLFTLSGRDVTHPVTCHYYITKTGAVYQLVRDAWIAWHAGVCRPWNGQEINDVSIGIELENRNTGTDPYPAVQVAAAFELVRAKRRQYGLGADRVIRHGDWALPPGRRTDPVGFDWEGFMAQVAASEPRTFTRRYRVTAGGATIRQAWWRPGPHEPSNIAGQLAPGTLVEVDSLHVGETINGEDLWGHIASGIGFVTMTALERA